MLSDKRKKESVLKAKDMGHTCPTLFTKIYWKGLKHKAKLEVGRGYPGRGICALSGYDTGRGKDVDDIHIPAAMFPDTMDSNDGGTTSSLGKSSLSIQVELSCPFGHSVMMCHRLMNRFLLFRSWKKKAP